MAREIAFVVLVFQVVVHILRAEGANFAVNGDERGWRRGNDAFIARGALRNANHRRTLRFSFARSLLNREQSYFLDSAIDNTLLVSPTTSGDANHGGPTTMAAPGSSPNLERSETSSATRTASSKIMPGVQPTSSEIADPTSSANTTSRRRQKPATQLSERAVAAKARNDTSHHRQHNTKAQQSSGSLLEPESTTPGSVPSTTAPSTTVSQWLTHNQQTRSRPLLSTKSASLSTIAPSAAISPTSVQPEVYTSTTRAVTHSETTPGSPTTEHTKTVHTVQPKVHTSTTKADTQFETTSASPTTMHTKTAHTVQPQHFSSTTRAVTQSETTTASPTTMPTKTSQTVQPQLFIPTTRAVTQSDATTTLPPTKPTETVHTMQPQVFSSTTRVVRFSTTSLPTTKHEKSETSVAVTPPVPLVTSTSPGGTTLDSALTLTVESEYEVLFKPNQKGIIVEPEWVSGTGAESRSQVVLKVHLNPTPSQRVLVGVRVANTDDVHVEELLFCGGLSSRAYLFDSDPRNYKYLEPQYSSASVSSTEAHLCTDGVRILVPWNSYQTEAYVVLSSKLPSPDSSHSATAFLRKSRYPKHPWNVRALRDTIPLNALPEPDAPVSTEVTSVFLISSAPWTVHEELRNTAIDGFKADVLDPFCDQTGTSMVSLIAGPSLGTADRVRIIPIPIGGCDPGNGSLRALLRALEEAAQRLSTPEVTASNSLVLLQDSEILQNGLENGSFQDVLSRIAQVGALAVIPISRCSSLSGMEGRFLSVGSFGFDSSDPEALQSEDSVLSRNLTTCASSVDLVAPGIGVTGAGTFGSLARREFSDASAAAAAAVGWLLATSATAPVKLFDVNHVRAATHSLPHNTFKNMIAGPARDLPNPARVIGVGNNSRYEQFVADLRDENLSIGGTSDDSSRDRIVSAISNPTFYGITAGVFVVCLAAAAGVGILATRRGNDDESILSEADSEFPPSPSAHQDVERGLQEREKSASTAVKLQQSEQADISGLFEFSPALQTATPQRQSRVVNDSENDPRYIGDRQSRGVEPLRIAGSTSLARQSGTNLDSSSSSQRGMAKSESVSSLSGRRRNVKTRLSTITKSQKPAASPGASKASWFATPKAAARTVSEFSTVKNSEGEPKEGDDDVGGAKGGSSST